MSFIGTIIISNSIDKICVVHANTSVLIPCRQSKHVRYLEIEFILYDEYNIVYIDLT